MEFTDPALRALQSACSSAVSARFNLVYLQQTTPPVMQCFQDGRICLAITRVFRLEVGHQREFFVAQQECWRVGW